MRGQPSRGVASSPREDLQPLYLYPDYVATPLRAPQKPLFDQDPIFQSVRDPNAQKRMISSLICGFCNVVQTPATHKLTFVMRL